MLKTKAGLAKKTILKELKSMGYKMKDRGDGHPVYFKDLGKMQVIILLTNQARVIIQSQGEGSYYIVVKEFRESFKTVSSDVLSKIFKAFLKSTKRFVKEIEQF